MLRRHSFKALAQSEVLEKARKRRRYKQEERGSEKMRTRKETSIEKWVSKERNRGTDT